MLYKKGDHRDLKNWRPVSLLNVDYKILAKILTNRLSNFLHKIVPEEQKCGVKGRKMNDVIRNLASYRDHSQSGFFVSIDQAKAFDRVNHEYLFMTMEALGFNGDFLELTKMLYRDITSQIMVNGQPTNKIKIQRGVRQGCPFSMILFVLSTIPLINMIKEEKKITGHITKHLRPVKVQSYADDTTVIINLPHELDYVMKIYKKHAAASEAAINEEKTQIFPLGRHVLTKLEHDGFTKKVKNKVTILGAIFCQNKQDETKENLTKAIKTLEKMKQGYSNFGSLAGKILRLNTFVFSTIWNSAWLINTKDEHYKGFIKKIERYLDIYKGREIREKVSKHKSEGGMGLINISERIRSIQLLEFLKADVQMPESDNLVFEIGTMQKSLYGVDLKRAKSSEIKPELLLLIYHIDKINTFRNSHKKFTSKNLQDILFPREKIKYFKEIYTADEPKLISTNYLMVHGLLSFRGNRPCHFCKKYEESLDHLLFHCPFLTRCRNLVRGWLRQLGVQTFNRQNIIEMNGVNPGIVHYFISLYKDTIWRSRNIAQYKRKVSDDPIYNTLESSARFYLCFIFKP